MNPRLARALLYYPTTAVRGEPVARYLREYRISQYWDPDRLARMQQGAVLALIRYAAGHSPYWSQRLAAASVEHPDDREVLGRVPYLRKADLVSSAAQIITRRSMRDHVKTTGGSTGQPVQIRKSANSLARERAATWRAYEWAGLEVAAPQARIWGRPITRSSRLRYRLIDFVSNRIRLSAFDLGDEKFHLYFRRLVRFRPAYIYGYVSAIREFVDFVHRRGLALPDSLKCIISTSELLSPEVRAELQVRTGLTVFNEYGCGEVGSIAHECERGGLHVMAENVLVEIDAPGREAPGEVVVTDLHNHVTPLIRYRLGDYAKLSGGTCACGRGLPLLEGVYGRAYDFLLMPDGRKIHPELPIYVFEEARTTIGGISQFQVIQTSMAALVLRVVPEEGADTAAIEAHLRRRFGEVLPLQKELDVEFVQNIQREGSGKMRVVKRTFDQG